MSLSQEQIDYAVKWWMDILKRPKFNTLGDSRRTHSDEPALFAEVMATVLNRESNLSDAQIELFGSDLKQALALPGRHEMYLGVDYWPDKILSEAGHAAGFPDEMTIFPWKTSMTFRNGGVQVKYGYGAPDVELLLATATPTA